MKDLISESFLFAFSFSTCYHIYMLSKLKPIHWILIGLGAMFLLTATGLAGWLIYDNYFAPTDETEDEESTDDDSEDEELDCDTIVLRDDWQIYADEEGFGYTIKYPPDWQYSEELFEGHSFWKVVFGPLGNISETAAIFIGEANYHPLENYRYYLTDGTSPPSVLGENEEVIVDDRTAVRFTNYVTGLEQFRYITYYVSYPIIGVNRLFEGNTEESTRHEHCESDVFYTMLGTYTFGQEYENEECGFSFRYPISWEVESEYYYETASGERATRPTIHLREFSDEDTNEWITMNPRQTDCYYVLSPTIEEEYVNGNKVTTYSNETQGARCIEAEVAMKDNTGRATTSNWISMSSSLETQEIFKQIIETFESE